MRSAGCPCIALSLILAALLSGVAAAQPAHRVADINTTQEDVTDPLFTGSWGFAVVGTTVFSLQDDGIHGIELWKSDGTSAGTSLVKDICPGGCSGSPRFLTVFNGVLYFGADDGVHGQELWRSDGTAAGTSMVIDLNPGLNGSDPQLLVAGGILYVSADDGVHGPELWKTDGTAAGTQLVADINPGAAGSYPRLWRDLGGKLLLNADDGVHGREPWLSDGTTVGTSLLADINPGAGGSVGYWNSSLDNDALNLGGDGFIFQADDGVHGAEPWITDGTAAGTALLLDVEPGSGASLPVGFTRFGNRIFFIAWQSATGFELWSTDGTPGGTALFLDINPGSGSAYPTQLTPWSNPLSGGPLPTKLLFAASDGTHGRELWATDGTVAGTAMVKDINPNPTTGLSTWGFNPAVHAVIQPFEGGVLFFADDGTHGAELWKSDGTNAGTVMVKDVDPGPGFGVYRGYSGIAVDGATAYFQGVTPDHGAELWKTDGTDAGTVEVKDVQTLASAFQIINDYPGGNFQVLGNKLLCDASDTGPSTSGSGFEPWVSDGTAAGTVQLGDLAPGALSGSPVYATPFGGTNFLVAEDGGLWTTDGTPGGTSSLVPRSTVQAEYPSLVPALGQLFFAGTDFNSDTELWKTDGTAAGTVRVYDIRPGSISSYPSGFTPWGSVLLFIADSDGSGRELWRTGGTGATTSPLLSSYVASDVQDLTPLGSVVLFNAVVHQPAEAGRELFVTDGTPLGTQLLKDIQPGAGSSEPYVLAVLGGRAILVADDGAHGREPWVTDGTAAGTVLLADINPGAATSAPSSSVTVGGTLFFVADDGVHGHELWKTDGTAAGTVLVKDIYPGARSADIDWMTAAGGRLFFVADNGVHGRELWVSDGTAVGTRMTRDIVPGAGSPAIRDLRAIDHLVLFSADDGVHGRELWRSDGGPAGTFMAQDITPGSAPSNPLDFVQAGGTVYFTANDNVTGNEIWAASKAELFATFQDVPSDFWAWRFIEALASRGITGGCSAGQYCPDTPVTRAQMAVLLLSARGDAPPPPATGTRFNDVSAGYWAASWIEQLAAQGIAGGCSTNPPLFCPDNNLTRAEMAVLLGVARHRTPPGTLHSRFNDVPDSYWALPWIELLAADGITGGCGNGNFCPEQPVTRAEMAVFLATAFGVPLP